MNAEWNTVLHCWSKGEEDGRITENHIPGNDRKGKSQVITGSGGGFQCQKRLKLFLSRSRESYRQLILPHFLSIKIEGEVVE